MIKNIILDIGNVLGYFQWAELYHKYLDLQEGEFEILENAMMKSGMWDEFDKSEMSDEEIVAGVIAKAPHLEAKIREFFRHMDEIVEDYEYSVPWINSLHEQGFKVYILSNYGRTAFADCCKFRLRFVPLVDGKVISYEIKKVKPGREIYEFLLNKYNLVPEECVFFDDRADNIATANELGIHGFVFTGYEKACEDLAAVMAQNS